jgi:hypothetical protein
MDEMSQTQIEIKEVSLKNLIISNAMCNKDYDFSFFWHALVDLGSLVEWIRIFLGSWCRGGMGR